MFRDSFHGFLNWISGGALSAALAMLAFVPTLEDVDKNYQFISICCFITAIPFLACALALYKEISWRNESVKPVDMKLGLLSLFGGSCLVFGILALCAAIHLAFALVFILSLLISTQLYKSASSALPRGLAKTTSEDDNCPLDELNKGT